MDQLKIYIEREVQKDWSKYASYLTVDQNKKDLDQIITFMFEDILPESILKDENSILHRLSKTEKIQLIDRPESFLSRYIQNIFRREKSVDNLVIQSIIRSFKGFKATLESKKKECNDHMKKIIQFFIEMKKSERVILTNKKLELAFTQKSVLLTRLLNPYELGEVFSRYLMTHMFNLPSSSTADFYKNIYAYIRNKDFANWHPLLKYGIFHFVLIEQLFKKDRTEFSQFFNIKLMKKFLQELSSLKHADPPKKNPEQKKGQGQQQQPRQQQQQRRPQQHMRGGGDPTKKYREMMLKSFEKKLKGDSSKKKSGEKRKYEERNKFIAFYNKILKETKVYNLYPGQNKSSDTLYAIFLENGDLKREIGMYYDNLLFKDPSHAYCGEPDEQNTQKCDFKKKVPVIFAEENPDAYFLIEQDLFSNKPGTKKEYATRGAKKEDRDQILNTLKEKLTMYKAYYVYNDKYFNLFIKDLNTFQVHLIYLLYMLYGKKQHIYKTFGTILDSVIEESSINENENENKNNLNSHSNSNSNKSDSNMNRGNEKNILQMVLNQSYSHLSSNQKRKMDLIYEKLKKLSEMREVVIKTNFGTPEYDEKIHKIDKYIQLLRFEAQKIVNKV